MNSRRMTPWLGVVVAVAVGCGGSNDVTPAGDAGPGNDGDVDAPVDGPPEPTDLASMCGAVPTTVADWERCYRKRECEMRVHCDERNQFTDVQECIDKIDAVERGRLSFEEFERERAIAGGTAAIDETTFTQCLIDLRPSNCINPLLLPSCALRFTGTTPDSQSCYTDIECASPGARCATQSCTDSCCPGTCVPRAKLGESCMDFFACEPGLVCSVGSLECVNGDIGSSCADDYECIPHAWCDDGTCRADLPEDSPCDSILQCAPETVCVGLMRPVEPAKCRRATQEGDICDWFCLGNLYCDLSGTQGFGVCRSLPTHGESGCSLFLPCIGVNDICTNGVCLERDDINEPCSDGTCLPGLFCTDQLGAASPVCKARLADNTAGCNQPGQCQSYVCGSNGSILGDCQPSQSTCP
jgi:hypothetical protein